MIHFSTRLRQAQADTLIVQADTLIFENQQDCHTELVEVLSC